MTYRYSVGKPIASINNLEFKRSLVRCVKLDSLSGEKYVLPILGGLDDGWNRYGDYSARPSIFKLVKEIYEILKHKRDGIAIRHTRHEEPDLEF